VHSGQLVGEHAHSNTHGMPLAEKALGTDIGDKLHGVERNRGVAGGNGFVHDDQHHVGRDAAFGAGAVGIGEHEHRKHEGVTGNSGLTGSNQYGNISTSSGQHHLGRDAALGAGAVGIGEHDHRKNERVTGNSGLTGSHQYGNTSTSTGQHHLGRDAALGAGAVGIGEHEHRKHEGITGNTSSGLSGNQYNTAPSSTGQHHLGRDAALGAGAVGVGGHEHHNHEASSGTSGLGSSNNQAAWTGPAPNTSGPHAADWLNKLDPRVDSKSTAAPTSAANVGTGNTGLTGGDRYGSGNQGVGEEYRKTDTTTGQGMLMPSQEMGGKTTGGLHHTGPSIGDERHRLHKEPPAGHPATSLNNQQQY
jgi:hypothetical protein